MRICPQCRRSYDRADISFCLDDGTALTDPTASTMAPAGQPLVPSAPQSVSGTAPTMAPSGLAPLIPSGPPGRTGQPASTTPGAGPSISGTGPTIAPSAQPLVPSAPKSAPPPKGPPTKGTAVGFSGSAPTMAPSSTPLVPSAPPATKPVPVVGPPVNATAPTMAPSGPALVPSAPAGSPKGQAAAGGVGYAPTMAPAGPGLVPKEGGQLSGGALPARAGAELAVDATMAPSGTPLVPRSGTAIGVASVGDSMPPGVTAPAAGGAGAANSYAFTGANADPLAGTMAPTDPIPQNPGVLVTNQNFPPVLNPLEEGSQVGEYIVGRKIGEGGMGVIFSGVHPIIGKKVALKVLNREMAHNPDVVQRFIQEAKSVNQIGHRNIVDIFSFGRLADSRHYFAMEFLEGQSLSSRLAAEVPVSWSDAIQIWLQCTSAIEAAHMQGIVHRDLKPDNIFLLPAAEGPFIKVLDFGIAKLLGDTPAGISKTGTGVPIGTPAYMSPEQARGSAVDARTDLYAFGIIMYETICGRPPFLHQSFVQLLTAHLAEAPPPLAGLVDIHPELNDLVFKLLEKEPEKRPPDMATVRAELIRLRDLSVAERRPLFAPLGELEKMVMSSEERAAVLVPVPEPKVEPQPPPPIAAPAPSRLPVLLGAVVVVGVGTFALLKLTNKPPPPQQVLTVPQQVIMQAPPSTIPKGMGRVQISTGKVKAKVFVDKSDTDKSATPTKESDGTFRINVPAGKAYLRFEAEGMQPVVQPVEVDDQSDITVPTIDFVSTAAPKQPQPIRTVLKSKPVKQQGPGEKPEKGPDQPHYKPVDPNVADPFGP